MASPFDRVGGVSTTATGEQLGSAGFTIFADAGNFFDTLGKAETAARRTGQAIGQSFGRGSNAAMGLLQLGQAIDDVQYGFRAIVNNIPMIAMGFGAGAGIAGAVSIAAVAVNQLINHWDELKASMADVSAFQHAAAALSLFSTAAYDSASSLQQRRDRGDGGKAASAVALGRGRAADAAAGEALFDKAKSAVVDRQRAADFAKAVEESGGMQAVLSAALKMAMAAPGADEATQKGRVAKWFNEGMRGGQFNPDAFGAQFGRTFDAQGRRRLQGQIDKDEELAAKARDEQKKLAEEKGFADRENQIRDMEKALQFRRERLSDVGTSQVFGSGHQFANNILTDALNGPKNKQLDEIKRTNQKLDEMKEILRRDRQAARFAR